MSEINLFALDPKGFKFHMKITADTPPEDLNRLLKNYHTFSAALKEEGFVPETASSPARRPQPSRGGRATERSARRGTPHKAVDTVPECDSCGGPVWDNREDKMSEKSPDFKCKDKESCGAAAWIREDGSLRWVEG